MPMIKSKEIVKLAYYKESGKYYSEEEYEIEAIDNYVSVDEVKKLIKEKSNFSQKYIVATSDNPNCFVNYLFTYDEIFDDKGYYL